MLVTLWGHLSYFLSDFFFYIILLVTTIILSLVFLTLLMRSSFSEKYKSIFLACIVSILSIVIIFCGLEAYFRYRFDESDSLGFLHTSAHWYARHVSYNNYQYRDRNFFVDKKPGTVRIGVMGDSIAFGYGIKNVNNRFSNLLEKELQDHGYNVEVYNFGVPGFGTEEEIKEYNRVKKFNFDILIWSYFLNDAEEASRSAGTQILQKAQYSPSPFIQFLTNKSYFLDFMYWHTATAYISTFTALRNADLAQYDEPEKLNHHTMIIDSFMNELTSQNKKVVAIVFPFYYFFPNYPTKAINIQKRIDTLFTNDGASSVIDMYQFTKGKKRQEVIASLYDAHPNEYVHKLAAEKLYSAIVPLLSKTPDGKTSVK